MEPLAIETERLALTPMPAGAIEALIDRDAARLEKLTGAVFPRPLVAPPENADALPFFLSRLREEPSIAPWWMRVVVRRETREAVGTAGFVGEPDEAGTVTMGYAIYPAFQGRGYATEVVRGLVGWALAQPAVLRVRATIMPDNAASRRVAEKAGLRRVETVDEGEDEGMEVWEIDVVDGAPERIELGTG
jgi:ribosomal-protein-alanine N-acetyltransferase